MKKIIDECESSNSALNRNIKGMNHFLSSKKGAAFLIAVFLMLIVMLAFGGMEFGTFEKAESSDVEKRLANIISKAEGIEKAEVMITYESSKTKSVSASGGLYSFDIGGKSAENKNESKGEIRGVVIAIKGADDYSVRFNVISMVKTALNVPSSKIEIINMK